jgi:HlyD family secretion protein
MSAIHTRRSAALAAVTAVLLLTACSPGEEQAATPNSAPTVSVSTVQMRPVQGGLMASGVLVPREEAAVAAELSGFRVSQVLVDQGDFVRRGQVLARLDDTLLRSQIDQARASLAQQEVAAERSAAEAARVEGLDDQGVLSEEAIAERRMAARSAQAGVAVAEAQLRDLQTRQGRMTITAPVEGRILERTVRPGDTSQAGTAMFRMARGGIVELDAEIPETELARVRPGARATVELPSGVEVAGVVRLVSPTVDQQTKLGRARLTLPVRADLRPGGFAKAVFASAAGAVAAVPEAAIRYDADGASVMVVQPDNRVRRVPVSTGSRSDGWVELREGPPAGSRVALGGSAFVLEGDLVRPVAPAAATATSQ